MKYFKDDEPHVSSPDNGQEESSKRKRGGEEGSDGEGEVEEDDGEPEPVFTYFSPYFRSSLFLLPFFPVTSLPFLPYFLLFSPCVFPLLPPLIPPILSYSLCSLY